MILKELRDKNLNDLLSLSKNLKKDLFRINMDIFLGKSNKNHLIGNLKRDLAKVITLINDKKLSE